MHMKNRKRFLALVAAAAMVLAPCTAFAADNVTSPAIGNASSSGNVEGWVDKEVFTVTLPTVPDGSLDFILDPQGLISDTSNAAYTGATFEADQTLFFKWSDGKTFKHESEEITITNKSSIPVDITVEAVATGDAVDFATDSAFTASENPEVYLAIATGGATDTYVDPETKKAAVSTQLEAVDESNFEVKYDVATKTYSYGLKSGVADSAFPKFTFKLAGSCNANADWADLTEVKPGVDLVWTVKAHQEGPSVTVTPDGLITVSGLTADLNMSSDADNLTLGVDGKFYNVNWKAVTADLNTWDSSNGGSLTIQLGSQYNVYNDNDTFTIKVKLTDGTYVSWTGAIHVN